MLTKAALSTSQFLHFKSQTCYLIACNKDMYFYDIFMQSCVLCFPGIECNLNTQKDCDLWNLVFFLMFPEITHQAFSVFI